VAAAASSSAGGGCGRDGAADAGADIVVRRSTDAGQSFEPLQAVARSGAAGGLWAPALVGLRIDAVADILLLATLAADARARDAGELDVLVWRSRDSGATWDAPVDISAQLGAPPRPRPAGGHGLVIMQGPHAGRLVVPALAACGAERRDCATAFLSNDGGATFRVANTTISPPSRVNGFAEMLWENAGWRGAVGAGTGAGTGSLAWGERSPIAPTVADAGVRGSATTWWGGRGWLTANARSPLGGGGSGGGDLGGNLTIFASQDGGSGGTGAEVAAPVAGGVDLVNFIWLQIVEFVGVVYEAAAPLGGRAARRHCLCPARPLDAHLARFSMTTAAASLHALLPSTLPRCATAAPPHYILEPELEPRVTAGLVDGVDGAAQRRLAVRAEAVGAARIQQLKHGHARERARNAGRARRVNVRTGQAERAQRAERRQRGG
jgi:hypothetical protein